MTEGGRGCGKSVVPEEVAKGVQLRGGKNGNPTWEETYQAIAAAGEDWSDLDAAVADGLD